MSVTGEYLRSSAVYAERLSGPLPLAVHAASLNSALRPPFLTCLTARA